MTPEQLGIDPALMPWLLLLSLITIAVIAIETINHFRRIKQANARRANLPHDVKKLLGLDGDNQ